MFKKMPIIGSCADFKELFQALQDSGRNLGNDFTLKLAQFSRLKYIYLTNSGISSFYVILKALKKNSRRQEVILPAYTAASLIVATQNAGLKPVLCDVSCKDYGLDIESLANLISQNTLAVVLVHMFGLVSGNLASLRDKVAQDMFIIEDCAQGMGSVYNGTSVGHLGDLSFFSFNRGKNLALGEGGCIATNSPDLSSLLDLTYDQEIRDSCFCENYAHFLKATAFYLAGNRWVYGLGYPAISLFKATAPVKDCLVKKISTFSCALGMELLEKIKLLTQERYAKGLYLLQALKGCPKIILPEIAGGTQPAFNRFPVIFQDLRARDLVAKKLWDLGIETSRMYLRALHRMFALGYRAEEFPQANFIAEHLLTFPMHSLVNRRDLDKIIKTVVSLT